MQNARPAHTVRMRDARCGKSRLLLALAYAVDHGVRQWAVNTYHSGQVALEVARAQRQMAVVFDRTAQLRTPPCTGSARGATQTESAGGQPWCSKCEACCRHTVVAVLFLKTQLCISIVPAW